MNQAQHILNKVSYDGQKVVTSETISVQYITNTDGSIRWIWPLTSKDPLFLKFYNINGWKARIFAAMVRLIFVFKIQRWIFTTETAAVTNTDLIDHSNWALFTGTLGPNQKYILYHHDATQDNGVFTKIALSIRSKSLIKNEIEMIQKLEIHNELQFAFPFIINRNHDQLSLKENIDFNRRTEHWTNQHSLFIQSLEKCNAQELNYENFDRIHQIEIRIDALKNTRKKIPSGILKKLGYLHHEFKGTTIKTHLAHGDFTPWNTYSNADGKLYVYDWELSRNDYPKSFDFFHFIIQKGIMTQRLQWSEIKNELHQSSKMSTFEAEKYLSLYLLVNALNYLETYENQSKWHEQIHWCLETWNMALSDILSSTKNSRELLVLDIFDHLYYEAYSGLKLNDQVEKVSEYSDIDILMTKSTSHALRKFLRQHPLISKINIHPGICMTKMMLLTYDHQILSLDAIHHLKRKSMVYMSVSELIKRPYTDRNGIKKMNLMDTLQFIGLFYGLNKAPIPEKYKRYEHIINTSNEALDMIINQQFITGIPSPNSLNHELNKLPSNNGFSAINNKMSYWIDTVLSFIFQKGMVITFSGVDGAGKSTIIENTKKEIEKKLRKKVVVIRHRPSILPILSAWTKGKKEAEKSAAESLPRLGQNTHLLNSLLRFGYYYSDYIFGQFYIYCKHVLRGDIVLYDRYYFDFINDSIRSNITLPKWLIKSGYNFLLKPNLNFFLYADAQIILSRKKELNEETINTLTHDYLELFKKLSKNNSGQYVAIENIKLDLTINFISQTIQSKLI